MKEVPLTQGKVAIVDDEDYEWLNQWKWYAHKKRSDSTYYARRKGRKEDDNKSTIFMHRVILGLVHRDGVIPDHKDRNGLNNQRKNLRIASPSLNRINSKLLINNSSGFRGVNQIKCKRKSGVILKWRVRISKNGERIQDGRSYDNAIDAAIVYDLISINLWGTKAPLNFPEKRSEYEQLIRNVQR